MNDSHALSFAIRKNLSNPELEMMIEFQKYLSDPEAWIKENDE